MITMIKKTSALLTNDVSLKFCGLQQQMLLSFKKSKGNPFRKKTKIKKTKINREHPVVKYMAEMDTLQTGNLKESVFEMESQITMHALETNKSQVLGFDLAEFRSRVQLFHSVGSTLSDAITLAVSLPSVFHVNNTNFKNVVKTLRSHSLSMEKLIHQNPFLGAVNHRHVESNLKLLSELIPGNELDNLVQQHPNLLVFQLDKTFAAKIIKSSLVANDKQSKLDNLKASLDQPAVENRTFWGCLKNQGNFQEATESDVIELLLSFGVDVKKVYNDCPEFLVTPIAEIEQCLEHITSSPFYFEVEDVEELLKNRPDIFLIFKQQKTLDMVKYLERIFKQKGHLYRLLSEDPEMLLDPDTFFERVSIFKKFGLKDYDIALLIAQPGGANCFTDCQEFTDETIIEILQFYYGNKDLVASQIVFSAPASLTPKNFPTIRTRIGYLRKIGKMNIIAKQRKKKRSHITIQAIIKCKLNHFLDVICETSLNHYQNTMEICNEASD